MVMVKTSKANVGLFIPGEQDADRPASIMSRAKPYANALRLISLRALARGFRPILRSMQITCLNTVGRIQTQGIEPRQLDVEIPGTRVRSNRNERFFG